MTARPVIGLNMSMEAIADEDRWEAQVPMTYIDAVMGTGGLPLLIPPLDDLTALSDLSAVLSGMIFIGGNDYWPHHFGGHPQPADELVPERRDRFDLALARWVLQETNLPVLGICGGHQLLALAQEGALIQDIPTDWAGAGGVAPLPHAKRDRPKPYRATYRHHVTMATGSLVAHIVQTAPGSSLETNSFHHQAVHPDRTGQDLVATAWTDDGIIEAIEPETGSLWSRQGRFILGVQWHPERMQEEEPQRRLFRALVAASQKASDGH